MKKRVLVVCTSDEGVHMAVQQRGATFQEAWDAVVEEVEEIGLPDEPCICGHGFSQHDPIDANLAGACSECDCEEYRVEEGGVDE